jgi:phage terminase small subunit
MAKPGPKRTPISIKELHGTTGTRDRRRGPEPIAPGLLIEPPAYLSPAQATRFREILVLAPRNLLRKWDSPTLAAFVVAESLLIEATLARQAEESLLELDSRGRTMVANAVKLQLRALAAMRPFISELGLSPGARASLTIDDGADTDGPEDNRWRRLLEMSRRGRQPDYPPPTAKARKLNGNGSGSIQ